MTELLMLLGFFIKLFLEVFFRNIKNGSESVSLNCTIDDI